MVAAEGPDACIGSLSRMPPRRIAHPVRAARNAAYRIAATLSGVEALRAELARTSERVEELGALLGEVRGHLEHLDENMRIGSERRRDEVLETLERNQREAVDIMQLLRDDEPGTRRQLWRVRETPEYAVAYDEPEPLVSVLIPTYTNVEGLVERALPSILSQTYERLEVVIVGDAAAPEVGQAVRGIGDERIRYANLTHRGPYPADAYVRWLVAGGPPANEAMRLARGRWIAQMDDDDICPANRLEVLLRAARERQLEFCYGQIRQHAPDGSIEFLSEFPPRAQAVSLTCSIMHAGMGFIASELGDALFGIVGDWARIRRMMRIGVRIGMIEDVVLDYYPGTLWRPRVPTEP
jgi:Glycosyl transferase family 2